MTIKISDDRGLICGFLLCSQGGMERLEWEAAIAALNRTDSSPVWLHFNLNDSRVLNWIETCDRLPSAARHLFLASEPRIYTESTGNGLMGVLGDLHYESNTDPDGLGVLRLYVDQRCIISGRRRPLKAIDRLRRELIDGLHMDTPIHLLAHFLQHLTEMFGSIVADYSDRVDDIEDRILKAYFQSERAALGQIRRLLTRLHRQVRANRHALFHLMAQLPHWCHDTDELLLRRNIERLDAVVQDLELVQERARLLQEEIAGRLEEAVNHNLYVLSIVTTIFLPITLISGIFGMNIGGLPWTEDPSGYGKVMLTMIGILAVTIAVLQRQRLF
jgi:zinc transporter